MSTQAASAAGRGVADVTVLWQGSLLDVVRVGRGESWALPSGTGELAGRPFVHVDERGLRLTPPPGLMLVEPQVPPSVRELVLPARSCARAVSGDLAFIVRFDDRHLAAERQRRVDKRLLMISSVAMIAQVSLLIAVTLAPRPVHDRDPGLLKTRAAFAALQKRPPKTLPARLKKRATAVSAPAATERTATRVPARARRGGGDGAQATVRALFGDAGGGTGLFAALDGGLRGLGGGQGGGLAGAGASGPRGLGGDGSDVLRIGDIGRDSTNLDDGTDLTGGRRSVRVRPETNVVLKGGLERDQIARVVNRHLAQLRHCYEKELLHDTSVGGRVGVGWTIDRRGATTGVSVETAHAGLRTCVARVVARMRFPQPAGGGEVFVRWPFVFTSAGE